MILLLHLNFDKRFKVFPEITNHSGLGGSPNNIEFHSDRLKVLKVREKISSLFQVVLKISSKLAPDAINKGLGVSEIFLKEGLELKLCKWSGVFVAGLVLGLFEADSTIKEYNNKKSTIHSYSARDFEIILILQTKMVVIYVRFSGISIWGSSFEWAILLLCQDLGLGCLYEHFHESDKEVLSEKKNKKWSGSFWKSRNFGRSLIALNVGSSCWVLSTGELILFLSGID